ncbi:type IV toxin-antitoxin system AbiEi family antitoxin domain-containing protein [Nocardioides sp.]|uniref:type IV toxin-antitoxin system AbiEi family antitoxin domain-containing protein n=1 Tax=Nocardioides sp. TaxID=35761 RepID=UPI00271F5190|nr:type IV toxin-antitoxin system AbiEi family antitoxin domain-containing protein [Nocardioides sp.]MDO9458040.1 type IV toxin-antitoxin system AbiEi family antitoxin domain-containing protein [Nocardioides sp.]
MTRINPRVVAHIGSHHGLITREQARDLGMSNTWIDHMLRQGAWLVLHRGVYVDAVVWHALDPWHGQPLLRARAAVMAMRRAWVLSHDSSVHALRLDYLEPADPPGPFVHITRPGSTNAWSSNRIKHHLARFAPEDVVEVDGLRTLGPARTVVDMAREHGFRAGHVTAASALRQGVTKNELWNVVDGMSSWPYITTVREVIEFADPGSMSAAEALAHEFVVELGVGVPDLQWPMQRADGRVAWCDIRVGRHVFEAHGKIKVLPPQEGGVAEKSATDVLWETRKRERYVTAEGLGVSNLYWEDFFSGRAAARSRVLAEVQQTIERFGNNVLPEHLERNAREIRARHDRPDAS